MKKFNELEIAQPVKGFTGDKIKIGRVLNKLIVVHGFKIGPSKFNNGECLFMQISLLGQMHVLFTGSQVLLDTIQKVPADGFPFETTIIEQDDRYLFS
jgi:hypothetical protein